MIQGKNFHVLNFNYTNPFESGDSNILKRFVTNVHGTCEDNNIIFGVDYTAELPPDTHIFAKTHRKMMQGTPDNGALPWIVDEIKFYGHSLGQADYSYFQSIFDYYNLYGDNRLDGKFNPVTLHFYFTVYDDSKKLEIERDATDAVYKLIEDKYHQITDSTGRMGIKYSF